MQFGYANMPSQYFVLKLQFLKVLAIHVKTSLLLFTFSPHLYIEVGFFIFFYFHVPVYYYWVDFTSYSDFCYKMVVFRLNILFSNVFVKGLLRE